MQLSNQSMWAFTLPGMGIGTGKANGARYVIIAGKHRWWAIMFGGNAGRQLVERVQGDRYDVLVTGPISWLWRIA